MVNLPCFLGVARSTRTPTRSRRSPYTITTGRDNNLDGVMNDRPAGVGRNSARGSARFDVSMRLSRNFSFGPQRGQAVRAAAAAGTGGGRTAGRGRADPAAAPGRWRRPGGGVPGGAAPQLGRVAGLAVRAAAPGGGGNPSRLNQRFSAEFWISADNVFNRVNYVNYIGNLRSPFFGQPTSAAPARRIEVGHGVPFLAGVAGRPAITRAGDVRPLARPFPSCRCQLPTVNSP